MPTDEKLHIRLDNELSDSISFLIFFRNCLTNKGFAISVSKPFLLLFPRLFVSLCPLHNGSGFA